MPLPRRALLRSLPAASAAALAWRRRAVPAPSARPAGQLTGLVPESPGSSRSAPVAASGRFTTVGVRMPPGARAAVRASRDGEAFGSWRHLAPADVEAEGPEGTEARRAGNDWQRVSTPAWTGPAWWLQVEVAGARLEEVEVLTVDTAPRVEDAAVDGRGGAVPWQVPERVQPVVAGRRIVRRDEWGADESLRGDGPDYAARVIHGVVHHTAGTNDYGPGDGPAVVRGIYEYHVRHNGWSDIGYNLLVDRFGTVYEGRYGGLDLPVIGAHARGANTGSFGVALLGDFRDVEVGWPEPRQALFDVLRWKFDLHAIDASLEIRSYDGRTVETLAGHRDVGSTSCPGDRLHALLDDWRAGLREQVRLTFSDVDGTTHAANIRQLRRAGVTGGYGDGTYRPTEPVSRSQMATFLTRAAQLAPGPDPGFVDVEADHPHRDGIAAVAAAGITAGVGDGRYDPDGVVTRGQMASFLMRALELTPGSGRSFDDVPPSHPHHEGIEAVAAEGIASGRQDGTFGPDEPVDRGQMATFLVRAFGLEAPDDDASELDPPDDPEGGDAGGDGSPDA